MTTQLFTDDWTFHRVGDNAGVPIRLPHDAMIGEPRSADAGTGNHGGYFPGGAYRYSKQWRVPPDAHEIHYRLFFEGVYGDTIVTVDGVEIARCNSGYRAFVAPFDGLVPGAIVTIEVSVDNTRTPNCRWYTGSGIYRPVWLEAVRTTHIARDGIRLVTRSLSPAAVVGIDVRVDGVSKGHTVHVEIADDSGAVGNVDLAVIDGTATGEMQIPSPRAWSAEDPHLYRASVCLINDHTTVIDKQDLRIGLRTINIDAQHGLRINNQQVLLRGACVHSDNGILGAVSLPAAEYRRARILKENGFNAVRASHNPISRPLLDACDEIGLYVMDELTDVWFQHKTKYDNADDFETNWRDDARAMVAQDRNRPSVILYSIGNEIGETVTERGVASAAEISEFLRELDATRPTTIAINLLLNMMAKRGSSPFEREQYTGDPSRKGKKKAATSTAANALTAKMGRIMELISRLPAADKVSRDAFAQVDVAGYNYAFGRYPGDRKRYPDRIIVGSESMPGDLPAIWRRVKSVPGVIGDFMWTGWDYLGEAGIGTWSYADQPGGINKPYPALLAGTGAIDINGLPGAPTQLARAVWGLLEAPAIAVRPLTQTGKRANKTPWRSTDAIASWAWKGAAGKARVEVYSADDEVELLLNGRSLGRKRAGAKRGFVTRFSVPYVPGELVAIGFRGGLESGRSSIRSAGAATVQLRPESDQLVCPDDLAYVWVEIADQNGVVESMADDIVTISIEGPAMLMGFGSAAPITEEGFATDTASTHFGRALAILRATASTGTVTVTASSERHGVGFVNIHLSLAKS